MAAKQKKKPQKRKHSALNVKKKTAAPQRAQQQQAKGSKSLFENLWTKRKFDVIGKKRKPEGRRVGLSRSIAIDKRKKTLLQEFKSRHKSNVFQDRRFGEDNEGLAEEDKAILRLQRERQVQWQKKSKFTLPDEDEEEAVLTHGGTVLSMLDDFNEEIPTEDEDGEELDDEIVRNYHFSGNSTNQNEEGSNQMKPKSKKEIMEEIIAKSKFYKAQKVKEREEDAELKDQLDKEFTELAQSQALVSLIRPKRTDALAEKPDKPDDFDKLVKEMGLELRAHASDRLKTEEEIAEEEKSRLEELEEKRKKRMLGDVDSDDDSEQEKMNNGKKSTKRRSEVSGDDLGENFLMEDDQPKKGWVDEVLARTIKEQDSSDDENEDDASSDEDGDGISSDEGVSGEDGPLDDNGHSEGSASDSDNDQSEELSADDWEKSDDDNHEIVLETIQGRRLKEVKGGAETRSHSMTGGHASTGTSSSLPFVIEAPKSLEEFRGLVDNRSITELLTVIQRIRTCNSIRLAAENRRKMQIFYGILLQYFASIAGEKVCTFDRLNALVKPLIELTTETPYFAAVCARQRIVRMRQQFSENLKNSDVSSVWPSVRTLLLLRLWSTIFPTSDFRHVVMTPCVLLMAEYLVRCPVKSLQDVAVGTFLCRLLLSVLRQARRFCPEAVSFLYAILMSAIPMEKRSVQELNAGIASQAWLLLKSGCSTIDTVDDLDFKSIVTLDKDNPFLNTDEFRLAVLNCVLRTVEGFCHIYEDLSSFPEIFRPFLTVLDHLSQTLVPLVMKGLINKLATYLKESIDKSEMLRQPLRMRSKKPVPIKQYNPKFEENFVRGRNYDPDRERAERKKLQRLLKQEMKGAARELRKDNYFLQAERAKEKAFLEEQRNEKYWKAMAFLQEQEAAFKSGQLGKGRKRRK